MIKHKKLALFWAAVSLLLVNVMPGLAQSRSDDADTLFNCNWTSATNYPINVLDNAVTSVGGNLYSFAGVSTSIVASSFRFDGTAWTAIAPLPVALEYPAAVTDGTNIYILGGSNSGGVSQTTLNRYNVGTNTYTPLAPFTTATWNHAAAYLNGKIYKFAGSNNTASTAVHEIYDVASNTWAPGAPYPLAISFVNAFVQGNFIYAAGGIQTVGSVESLKTFRYNPATNTWDDAAIADLPATRWGAASAVYQTDGVLAGGFSGGAIENTAISWDAASNTWQNAGTMVGERARMNGAVLGANFYVIGGRSNASPAFVGTNSNQRLLCVNGPGIGNGGSSIVSAGPNGTLDPGEVVTVALGLRNIGGPGVVCTTAALSGALQASGGVTSPPAPVNYGMVCSNGAAVFRNFTFTVDPALPCGNTVTASLVVTDGAINYGTFTYTFITGNLGTPTPVQNFDGVVAPALPAGWVATASGSGTLPTTSTIFPDTAPNDVFLSEAATTGLSEVMSATIAVPGGVSSVSFRNLFNTEEDFDGLVLEISINGGAFSDIITAGGSFLSGGYNSFIGPDPGANPLENRSAWTGLSGGTAAAPTYITSVVRLPAAAAGQNIQLKWRQGSDSSVVPATNPGSRIDTIAIASSVCNTTSPTVSSAVSRKTHGAAGPFNINLPLVPLAGAVGIEDRSGAVAGEHQMVVTFAASVTVGGVTVTTGTGNVGSFSVAGAVVTINLTGVTNAQRLGVTLSSVNSGANLGSVMVPMGVLSGDAAGIGNGTVNAGDVSAIKAQSGAVVGAGNFRTDVNSNGSINAGDVGLVKSRSGTSLPP
jgi:N-acetylneuraminic acid mutarotase